MPTVQSFKLQRVLQSETLCICQKRQSLSEEEETKDKTEEKSRIQSLNLPNLLLQPISSLEQRQQEVFSRMPGRI